MVYADMVSLVDKYNVFRKSLGAYMSTSVDTELKITHFTGIALQPLFNN
jgi:hypothetical protein